MRFTHKDLSVFRKERDERRRKIIARKVSHLPMPGVRLNIILVNSLVYGVVGGLIGLLIQWFQTRSFGPLFFGIGFGITFVLVLTLLAVEPDGRAIGSGYAHAELGRTCLKFEDYEAAICNLKRAIQDFEKARYHPLTIPRAISRVYPVLGQAYCALGRYEQSLTYYSLALKGLSGRSEQESISYEIALVKARIPAMQMQAKQDLLTILETSESDKNHQAIPIRVALAALAIARGDLKSFVSYRLEAIKRCEDQLLDALLIQHISLLSLLCANVGDAEGAVETALYARRSEEHIQKTNLSVGDGPLMLTIEEPRNEQIIAYVAALLSESSSHLLCEDYNNAVSLAQQAASYIRERCDAALLQQGLRKWELVALFCLGKAAIGREESELFWHRYYTEGRPFALFDDPAVDDFDYHDYVGYGLHALLGAEDALEQEKGLLDEAQQSDDKPKQIEHLQHISSIYQAARNWPLAMQYQAQALEIARSQGFGTNHLGGLLRYIALTLQASRVSGELGDLTSLFDETQLLLSETSNIGNTSYRAWGLSKLAGLCFAWGNVHTALEYYREAVEIARSSSLLILQMDIYLQLATILDEQERWKDALATYTAIQSLALAEHCPFTLIQELQARAGCARCMWHLRRSAEDTLHECELYLQLNSDLGMKLTKHSRSIEFRPRERDSVNNLKLQTLHEDLDDNARVLEQIEYARTAKAFSLNDLQAFLQQQTIPITIAEYHTLRDYTLLCVIDTNHQPLLSIYQLPISLERVRACMERFTEEVYHYQQWLGELGNTWQELAQPLIEPLAAHLNKENVLCVIPHGLLYHLPFHAIQYKGRYLIDYCPIFYAPDASIVLRSQSSQARTWTRAIVLGNPNFDLDEAMVEVREVAKLFGVIPRIGQDAKFDLHREHIDTDILHVATHGLFDPDRPALSGILLADELLTVQKISAMQIQANLVTLSGCETGLSRVAPGEQLVGLTKAFIEGGIPSIIVSQWKADDEATAKLMVDFYTQLRSGACLIHALHSAQLRTRRLSPKWDHPYYWAPFVLVGAWQ
jgi:CHAT domain-containing protein